MSSDDKTIDERIEELKELDPEITNGDLVRTLYDEGYNTGEIMKRHLPLRALKRKTQRTTDDTAMAAIEGVVKGTGYLDELKTMIRTQISRSRELTEFFYNVGLGTLLASLNKSGMSMEEFRKIALEEKGLRDALQKAGETAFKALEYYKSDLVEKVEKERDEARAAYSVISAQVDDLTKRLTPNIRLERMLTVYLTSGNVDPDALSVLVDKWLAMKEIEIRTEMIEA